MIDLKFELNDMTDKYEARSHHTEIYISDGTKMDEDTVRLYKHILDEMIQQAIGALSHLIHYNSKNNDDMTIKEVRDSIEQLFHKKKSRIHSDGEDLLTGFPQFRVHFEDLSKKEKALLGIHNNAVKVYINYYFDGPIDNKNTDIVVASFFTSFQTELEGSKYDKFVKIGEAKFYRDSMLPIPVNGNQA